MNQTFNWSEDRIFPSFAFPNSTIDIVQSQNVPRELLITLSVLQGHVNKVKPQLMIVDSNAGEGFDTWPKQLGLSLNEISPIEALNKYNKYSKGIVLYNTKRCHQFINLAATIAGIEDGIPMERSVYHRIFGRTENKPQIIDDISELRLYNSLDVYGYMYDNIWPKCSHRILFSLNPRNPFQMRDLASATKCATVWLDCRNSPAEKELYEKFLSDMTPGKSICTGWYTEERSGITTAAKYGLSTVPSDYFVAPTIYAHEADIHIRPEPEIPTLENKMYISVFVSDGDNIQYCQHYMRQLWDKNNDQRGKVAVNWTISPALCDIAPDIMNYFYDNSTEKDCFVSGPSGLGYAMPCNTLDEDIPCGNYVKDDRDFEKYVTLSNRYFERCGLRVVTVWDDLTDNQRRIYADNAPYIYGLTVQQFTEDIESSTSVNDGFICKQLTPCYTTTAEHLTRVLERELNSWDGNSPKFVASQISSWGNISLSDLADIEKHLSEASGGKVEFIRSDVFFKLYKQTL